MLTFRQKMLQVKSIRKVVSEEDEKLDLEEVRKTCITHLTAIYESESISSKFKSKSEMIQKIERVFQESKFDIQIIKYKIHEKKNLDILFPVSTLLQILHDKKLPLVSLVKQEN